MDTEYTLEVWDGVTGQWMIVNSSTTLDGISLAGLGCEPRWRIVKTEVTVVKAADNGIRFNC